ncbi:DNA gyrase/topoisomerase IV subunit A [Actomonas aquatica]|uniref:DNA gyrase/topoisomerase IV subunit A n=1 Tax=Actomonas aquatica TaxID=2866162 RepID=A0ABZ1C5Z7_9BACT|nr:DNA gyrase/topoisomerase IV subunit A [Opitutus sp. WL0086]WRQ86678.1 DNA gyrase/topoisomerase IV subunit A [Opitutus sp. WL0086]
MPKRKSPKDEQPELELAAQAAADADAAETPEAPAEAAGGEGDGPPPQAPLAGAYRNWFLDYASYVILDRAVPHINDGLKPVQRRILHTLWDKDDGRFHKVANIVGATMAFHPHGDASIEAALVNIAQRGYLIEPQGNFGNTLTGDGAAAARYIEARLTPFAREVIFNPKTTVWQQSYDGRAKEPVTLPAKFPLVLLEGAEGIAVGLSTKILPHNFNDLCRASINYLQGKTFRIRPDFPTGGTADFSDYNDGARGGRVKVRATIESQSKYVLAVTELAYGTSTTSLIESILSANAKGKIKIKHVDDNTADKVEILIHLPQGADPKQVKQQLYAFTDCQVSISPAACVIENVDGRDRPAFLGVSEILKRSTDQTVGLLKQELEIKLGELEQQWHWDSLERIFIEERIYRRIEKSTTWESVLEEIRLGLEPFLDRLQREVTDDDITRLTEIRIKRISAYNRFKADEKIKQIEADIKEVKHHLAHLVDYAIAWFESLQEKYGKGRKRRTSFDEIAQINVKKVIAANQRLYVDREGGFVGLNWRQHEFVTECRPIDQVMCIMADGTLKMTKVTDKVFMGRNILHVSLFDKAGPPEYFTLLYQDKKSKRCFAKRFTVGGLTRDKLYSLVASEGSQVVYFDVTKNESAMPTKLRIQLSGRCKARVKDFEIDLSGQTVSTRSAKGVTVTKYPVRKVTRVLGAGESE